MTLEDIANKLNSLFDLYNRQYREDWLKVYRQMDNDTKAKFSLQTPQVPPVDRQAVPVTISPIIESTDKGQDYDYIERMKLCANLLVEAKQQAILFVEESHQQQIKEIKTNWPFRYKVNYRKDVYPLNRDWGMTDPTEVTEVEEEELPYNEEWGVTISKVEQPSTEPYYGFLSRDWVYLNTDIDPLFMAPKQVQWEASLTGWWDKLKEYGAIVDIGTCRYRYTVYDEYTLLWAVSNTCNEICKAAGQPNHTKNMIIKEVEKYNNATLGITLQILLLDGLRYWTDEVATNKEISGYREIESLHRWINERLKDKLRQWADTPFIPNIVKQQMTDLGNYIASTPIGQEVIKEMTGQVPMSLEARRTRYINLAIQAGWAVPKQDNQSGQMYEWIYDKQPRTERGNKTALTAFLSKIYWRDKPQWSKEQIQWGVSDLKQTFSNYLSGNKQFNDIEEMFELT